MVDLVGVVKDVRDTLVAELEQYLMALYLFGSAARGEYISGHSDIDLLLVADPAMPLITARTAFRRLCERYGDALGRGPLVATPKDLAQHLALFPSFHRSLLKEAFRFHGESIVERLTPPPPPDPLEEIAQVAVRTITCATALTGKALSPEQTKRLNRMLDHLARRVTGLGPSSPLAPLEAILALHARMRELAAEMPQFEWHGDLPSRDVPVLLPGCLAFYQREKHLIAVVERVDQHALAGVDWNEVGAAAQDAHAFFGLATPWQLRLAASEIWVDSLYFQGFEHVWGADILGDLEADETTLLRQLARVASEQRVENVPSAYLFIDDGAVSKLIHDTQNVLLNAGLRAELFARFTEREFDLPAWTPPGREVPQPERVAATWERWREVTSYYFRLWREVNSQNPQAPHRECQNDI